MYIDWGLGAWNKTCEPSPSTEAWYHKWCWHPSGACNFVDFVDFVDFVEFCWHHSGAAILLIYPQYKNPLQYETFPGDVDNSTITPHLDLILIRRVNKHGDTVWIWTPTFGFPFNLDGELEAVWG